MPNDCATFTGLEVEDYRAFHSRARLRIAPLTIVIGRNNAGKSALVRAPYFLTQVLAAHPQGPFSLQRDGLEFATSFAGMCYRGAPLGFAARIEATVDDSQWSLEFRAAADGRTQVQYLTDLVVTGGAPGRLPPQTHSAPHGLRSIVAGSPFADARRFSCGVLIGQRAGIARRSVMKMGLDTPIGFDGTGTPSVLWANWAADRERLEPLQAWLRTAMDITLEIENRDGEIELRARRLRGDAVANVVDSGDGVAQVLPVLALMKVSAPAGLPRVLTIEHPELHLHPRAHGDVAELFISMVNQPAAPRLIVETHSDPFVLRVRAAIAERRLRAQDVCLLYVDDDNRNGEGSSVRPISFDDRGTPDFWPRGVFAEPQAEFARIRRALASREAVA